MIFVGDDWSEDHHDVCLMDQAGKRLASRRLPEGLTGIRQLHELIAEHAEEPDQVVIGIETDRGLWAGALAARPHCWHSRTSPTAMPWGCWGAHRPLSRALIWTCRRSSPRSNAVGENAISLHVPAKSGPRYARSNSPHPPRSLRRSAPPPAPRWASSPS